ncbi:hypothetical protein Curi_c07980 [Gottschalkia acidurici 9a]|uniref:DUF2281 domain-containing protein n=1 Tax=Gottschalkia acidurici (strain ATCC 7906 / DSM 604 / BCRC 14475 / CIP 104303 / KCTC 5404 / NCIMB 10678 / 9a) TaxID=1128398 RepID=K0AZU2_GOTA9|nr:hypothetical protein [Gottschalkia acidurici]AFS77871.1 hypothetical protein Curi_c07980 [Gottschalkia acidurici 9a]
MINREVLVKRIQKSPPYLLEEVSNYIDYIEFKRIKENIYEVEDITLASEKSLSKDWLKPEEDEAWADL